MQLPPGSGVVLEPPIVQSVCTAFPKLHQLLLTAPCVIAGSEAEWEAALTQLPPSLTHLHLHATTSPLTAAVSRTSLGHLSQLQQFTFRLTDGSNVGAAQRTEGLISLPPQLPDLRHLSYHHPPYIRRDFSSTVLQPLAAATTRLRSLQLLSYDYASVGALHSLTAATGIRSLALPSVFLNEEVGEHLAALHSLTHVTELAFHGWDPAGRLASPTPQQTISFNHLRRLSLGDVRMLPLNKLLRCKRLHPTCVLAHGPGDVLL